MREQYSAEAIGQIKRVLASVPIDSIWLFSDQLMDHAATTLDELCDALREKVGGGTRIDVAFNDLKRRMPSIRKLLLITDSGFFKPDFGSTEVIETPPQLLEHNLRSMDHLSQAVPSNRDN